MKKVFGVDTFQKKLPSCKVKVYQSVLTKE